MSLSLPPWGWTAHTEQIDAASLAARVWQMNTTLVVGRVITALLQTPTPEMVPMLERVAKAHEEHKKKCKDPLCITNQMHIAEMCPGGKFDPAICIFYTVALDVLGQPITELRVVALDPATAIKNHYEACTMMAGVAGAWGISEEQKA